MGQKIRRNPQPPLCGVALEIRCGKRAAPVRSSPWAYRFPFLEGTGRAAGPGRFGAALLRGAGFPLFLAAPVEPTLEWPDLGGFPGFAGGAL